MQIPIYAQAEWTVFRRALRTWNTELTNVGASQAEKDAALLLVKNAAKELDRVVSTSDRGIRVLSEKELLLANAQTLQSMKEDSAEVVALLKQTNIALGKLAAGSSSKATPQTKRATNGVAAGSSRLSTPTESEDEDGTVPVPEKSTRAQTRSQLAAEAKRAQENREKERQA